MCKKLSILLIAIVLCFIVPFNAYATTSETCDKKLVWDEANILSETEELQLQKQVENLCTDQEVSIIFLTTKDTNGWSSEQYAKKFYNEHNFHENGVLYMIDLNNSYIFIHPNGTFTSKLTESVMDDILEDNFHYATNKNFFDCMNNMYLDSTEYIKFEKVDIPIESDIVPNMPSLFTSVVITIIVTLLLFFKHNNANKTTKAQKYMNTSLQVHNKSNVFIGDREIVRKNFYKKHL